MNDLREAPTTTGQPSAARSGSAARRRRLEAASLPKPMPGSSRVRSAGIPAAAAAAARPARNSCTSATTSAYAVSRCIVAGSPRMCMRTMPAPRPATTASMRASRAAVTSLTRDAPAASAAAATSGLEVSTETITAGRRRASAATTGTTRSISSATGTVAAPGRVDSPPTSMTSAPASDMARACATAASGAANRPPSENESGVTLTTPITAGRPRRHSSASLRSSTCQLYRSGRRRSKRSRRAAGRLAAFAILRGC